MSSRRQLVNWSPLSECRENVYFAAGLLAPYPDMAMVPGRFHMKRYEIICLLYQKDFFLGLILDLEMALRSLPFEGLIVCVKLLTQPCCSIPQEGLAFLRVSQKC